MPPTRRQFRFDERGLPTLAQRWTGELPDLPVRTQRRARGELALLLDRLVKQWMLDPPDDEPVCSAEYLKRAVIAFDGRSTSTAAIFKVFRHWQELGYAIIEENPVRFVSLTEQGFEIGLEELKRRKKRADRAIQRGMHTTLKPRK